MEHENWDDVQRVNWPDEARATDIDAHEHEATNPGNGPSPLKAPSHETADKAQGQSTSAIGNQPSSDELDA